MEKISHFFSFLQKNTTNVESQRFPDSTFPLILPDDEEDEVIVKSEIVDDTSAIKPTEHDLNNSLNTMSGSQQKNVDVGGDQAIFRGRKIGFLPAVHLQADDFGEELALAHHGYRNHRRHNFVI